MILGVTMTNQIKRYALDHDIGGPYWSGSCETEDDSDGELCKYSDHKAIMDKVEPMIKDLVGIVRYLLDECGDKNCPRCHKARQVLTKHGY